MVLCRYLKHLEQAAQLGTGRWATEPQRAYAVVCARCLGELLVAAPHFNFRAAIVKLLATKAGCPVAAVREVCCGALRRLFVGDRQGDVSLEAVKTIAKAVKEAR